MTNGPEPQEMNHVAIQRFLEHTPPFDVLPKPILLALAGRLDEEHIPKGTVILERGKTSVDRLRLIHQGRIRIYLKDEAGKVTLNEVRGPGEAVGQLALLRNSLSNLDVIAEEDTDCLLMPREDFLDLVRNHLPISNYYLKALSEGYISKALDHLERPRPTFDSEGSLYLFSVQVGDIIRRRPITIPGSETIQRAAGLMTEKRVGCLLVTDPAERIVGIITDRDLRNKVVAPGLSVNTLVEKIMVWPIQTIPAHTVCFDALIEMMRRRVHHLALEKNNEIVGILSGHDLMVAQGASPLSLVREIVEARRLETLFDLSLKTPRVVRGLIHEGAKAGNITRMITLLNDYILGRLLGLLEEKLGPPPAPYCWLLMGSEGRREQTFRTDQDNGLMYRDPDSEAEAREAEEYFQVFADEAVKALVACGFPRCKGDVMASNPTWRRPYSAWQGYFDQWIRAAQPMDVLHATIFFDFRSGHGDESLGDRLRTHLLKTVAGQDVFFRLLAKDTLTSPPPLTFFRGFALEKNGPSKNRLDIKTKGLTPLVDFARLLSLRHGVKATNTLERLQLLGESGAVSREMQVQASQAYEFQMQIRLIHQQALYDDAQEPDNFIDPAALSDLDRSTLKEAFGVIQEIKSYLKEAFHLASA